MMLLSDFPTALLSSLMNGWISYQDLVYVTSGVSRNFIDSKCKSILWSAKSPSLASRLDGFVGKDESMWIFKHFGVLVKYQYCCDGAVSVDPNAQKLTFNTEDKLDIEMVEQLVHCSSLTNLSITCGEDAVDAMKLLVAKKPNCLITLNDSFAYNPETKSIRVNEKKLNLLKIFAEMGYVLESLAIVGEFSMSKWQKDISKHAKSLTTLKIAVSIKAAYLATFPLLESLIAKEIQLSPKEKLRFNALKSFKLKNWQYKDGALTVHECDSVLEALLVNTERFPIRSLHLEHNWPAEHDALLYPHPNKTLTFGFRTPQECVRLLPFFALEKVRFSSRAANMLSTIMNALCNGKSRDTLTSISMSSHIDNKKISIANAFHSVRNLPNLTVFELEMNEVSSEDLHEIVSILSKCPRLQEVLLPSHFLQARTVYVYKAKVKLLSILKREWWNELDVCEPLGSLAAEFETFLAAQTKPYELMISDKFDVERIARLPLAVRKLILLGAGAVTPSTFQLILSNWTHFIYLQAPGGWTFDKAERKLTLWYEKQRGVFGADRTKAVRELLPAVNAVCPLYALDVLQNTPEDVPFLMAVLDLLPTLEKLDSLSLTLVDLSGNVLKVLKSNLPAKIHTLRISASRKLDSAAMPALRSIIVSRPSLRKVMVNHDELQSDALDDCKRPRLKLILTSDEFTYNRGTLKDTDNEDNDCGGDSDDDIITLKAHGLTKYHTD